MANRWGNSGNSGRLNFGGSKITADGDCSHEIKRHLLLGRKVMTNLDSILKSKDIASPTKVHLVKPMVFPVVMYGWESWTIKKAEHWRIDAFELWCWRRLLRATWTARISNQSIIKEITPGCSLEGLMLKLKLQSFGHLMRRTDSLEKTLMLGKIEGGRRRGQQRMRCPLIQWTWVWVNSRSWWWTGRPGVLQSMGSQRVGHDWATELNWTDVCLHSPWRTLTLANFIFKFLTALYFLMPSSFLYPTHIESGDMYSSDTLADLYSVLVLCACWIKEEGW